MSEIRHIENTDQLEFAVFCIENTAESLGTNARRVYDAIANESDILYGYIVPGYDVLHTQGKDYIVNDIINVMDEKGISI